MRVRPDIAQMCHGLCWLTHASYGGLGLYFNVVILSEWFQFERRWEVYQKSDTSDNEIAKAMYKNTPGHSTSSNVEIIYWKKLTDVKKAQSERWDQTEVAFPHEYHDSLNESHHHGWEDQTIWSGDQVIEWLSVNRPRSTNTDQADRPRYHGRSDHKSCGRAELPAPTHHSQTHALSW